MRPGEFRFTAGGKSRKGHWNSIHATTGRPADFFCKGAGKQYLTLMDEAMFVMREQTGGSTTMELFKGCYYRVEGNFREWLRNQPPQVCFDFLRDFGDYDARFMAMMMRYEARRGSPEYRPVAFRSDDEADGNGKAASSS
jgi:hypothetical protein